ncbi:MAG TPA: tripartite tricarboxylate transporter substrate-binding protein [Xanthobacteraceae bacterium]
MNRRHALALLGSILAAPRASAQAPAPAWPTRTVKLIVPFGAGSTPDTVMRVIADHLKAKLGQSFIVENKPGASGNLGTDAIAKATPDGYTLGLSIGGPLAINPILFGKLPYDPKTDIAPVTLLVTQPSVLAVNPALGVGSVADLVALLKKDPGKYNFGSIGAGSLSHLAMEAIALKSGTQIVHVPYASSPAAVTALLRNDVQMVCLPAISVTPQAAAGKLEILAVSTAQRSGLLPGVPTLKEAGIDVEADAWNGLIAPAKTPPAIIEAARAAVADALDAPDVRRKLAAQLMEAIPSTPAQFRARIDADVARWTPVIKAANIKVN